MTDTALAEAEKACLELCSRHGFATGHGDTLADIIHEIDAQISERDGRAEMLLKALDQIPTVAMAETKDDIANAAAKHYRGK